MKTTFFILFMAVAATADPVSTHGMAVFGKKTVYLSHLPMFHAPHAYQVIFTATFDQTGMNAYTDAGKNPTHTFYTMQPEPFALPELVSKLSSEAVTKQAKLFTGVFDEEGTSISPAFQMSFAQVLYFKKFIPSEPHPSHPHYLLMGDPNSEIYVTHLIHSAPDFDQIIEVESIGPALMSLLKTKKTCHLIFTGIDGDQALTAAGSLAVSVIDDATNAPLAIDSIQLGSQVYFNSEDLAQ